MSLSDLEPSNPVSLAGVDPEELRKFENLVRLLDAESASVREAVGEELAAFGERLSALTQATAVAWSPEQQFLLSELLDHVRSRRMRGIWEGFAKITDVNVQLERVLTTIGDAQPMDEQLAPLSDLLDAEAEAFRNAGRSINVLELNQFLFADQRFRGAHKDYYNPRHCHLSWVLQHRQGLPISLVCIFMLVAHRFDLVVEGFNLPRHFLAKATVNGNLVLIDCFNNGKILSGQEIAGLTQMPNIDIHELLSQPPSPGQIGRRVLLNLVNAYNKSGELPRSRRAKAMLEELNQMPRSFFVSTPRISPDAQYRRGQLVRHGRYGYRGVVVDYDPRCLADESWYRANKTQPERNQPWYHVLVHGSNVTTYAAQTSLIPDYSGAEVIHPLIDVYFDGFANGFYVRNERPWNEES
ncbi:heat shock protein HspQ [Acanthopleuribacter pedis]|uniref:Heat shock protein HspQ n=1 Tax=Acanthopleuribacter pedis TaxID=442870 RepID=A0A8J7QB48_9BACT|nr:heat shock protein HspQ [Acanthopleuribacter pedis]MBO1320844.1 heat shock protein HspQ [Acanthopleuribacter pedis]